MEQRGVGGMKASWESEIFMLRTAEKVEASMLFRTFSSGIPNS